MADEFAEIPAALSLPLPTKRHVVRSTKTPRFRRDLLSYRLWTALRQFQMMGDCQELAHELIKTMLQRLKDDPAYREKVSRKPRAIKDLVAASHYLKEMVMPELAKLLKEAEAAEHPGVVAARLHLAKKAQQLQALAPGKEPPVGHAVGRPE